MLDDSEVFDAISQYDTNSVEAESDILEAVEMLAPAAPVFADEHVMPEPVAAEPIAPPVHTLPPAPATAPEAPKSGKAIKHGFDF
jgi:hypothetical protein